MHHLLSTLARSISSKMPAFYGKCAIRLRTPDNPLFTILPVSKCLATLTLLVDVVLHPRVLS
jgi:hypothetical protein